LQIERHRAHLRQHALDSRDTILNVLGQPRRIHTQQILHIHLNDRQLLADLVDTAARFLGRYGIELVESLKMISQAPDWMTAWNQIWDF
jgi:hypothetical protein